MIARRALLLLNRKARSGETDVSPALDRLREGGFALVEETTDQPLDISRAIRDRKDDVDLVIVGGGDGTITHAASGLIETGLPLGVLPLGTANDLARTLEIPTDPLAAAEVIVAGHRRRIDLGRANGNHFFNVASIGLTAGVTRKLNSGSKSRWGVFAYLFAAMGVVIRSRPFTADIVTPEETVRVRTVQVTVGNGKHYGGGMTVDKDAAIDDGLLNLYSLEVSHWWQVAALLPSLRAGTMGTSKRVRTMTGTRFEVRPLKKRPKTIMADGEITGRTPAEFDIVPGAVEVFVPPPATE